MFKFASKKIAIFIKKIFMHALNKTYIVFIKNN